jgi:hypothetical protein
VTAVEPGPEQRHRDHLLLYTIVGVALVVLFVVAVVRFNYQKDGEDADAKAAQLEQKWTALGLRIPENDDVLVRLFGTDGGPLCDTSDDHLSQGLLRLAFANGASGPGQRAVTVDEQIIQGERAVIEVYCPENLEDFDDFVNDLDFDNVIRG